MGTIKRLLNKFLGRITDIQTKGDQFTNIKITAIDYQNYIIYGVDMEGMKVTFKMQDIIFIKEKRPSRLPANEDLQ